MNLLIGLPFRKGYWSKLVIQVLSRSIRRLVIFKFLHCVYIELNASRRDLKSPRGCAHGKKNLGSQFCVFYTVTKAEAVWT